MGFYIFPLKKWKRSVNLEKKKRRYLGSVGIIYTPASSKGCCLNPKRWCIGTPYHPLSTPWKIQADIYTLKQRRNHFTLGDSHPTNHRLNGCHSTARSRVFSLDTFCCLGGGFIVREGDPKWVGFGGWMI